MESKLHYRDSNDNSFGIAFPFPPEAAPPGTEVVKLRTTDPGQHVELSTLSFITSGALTDRLRLHFRIDGIDKHDRNPTSGDHEVDIDSLWLRYGSKSGVKHRPATTDWYIQTGKFAKFERQNDRHLESYGLVSTAFNRFEDSGFEIGLDFSSGFYGKFSLTTGNPLFFRDPNALAGDNGTQEFRDPVHPDPEFNSGLLIFYDAEIERMDPFNDPETGLGLGYRFSDEKQGNYLNVLLFGYQRNLDDHRSLHGTFYGGDLDILDLGEVPGAGGVNFPVDNRRKKEYGINLWFYHQKQLSAFAQYVKQDIGGQKREGWELEFSWSLANNVRLGDTTILSNITPALRYSYLNPDFKGSPLYPAPSVNWQWKKLDYGIRMNLLKQFRFTIEYADNRFIRKGSEEDNNEFLTTLTWRYRFKQ